MDHPGQLPAGVDEEGGQHVQPVQQRFAAGDVADQETHQGQPGVVHQVAVVAHRDVVAEPARVFVGVGVTADPHDQRRVVDAVALGAVEAQPVGQPGRDQRGAQHVFAGLSESQVDRDRQGGEQLGAARGLGRRSHAPIMPGGVCSWGHGGRWESCCT